jgi:predicted LPLAT superfamily acyltransferase
MKVQKNVLGTSFSPWSGCCFSAKQAALRRKSKDWLARNQDTEYEWSDMSTHVLLFQ